MLIAKKTALKFQNYSLSIKNDVIKHLLCDL